MNEQKCQKKCDNIPCSCYPTKEVPFVKEVIEFNNLMGKGYQNRITPTINKKDAEFIVNFIKEELLELQEAYLSNDIIEVADALGDIMYVLCNGISSFGLVDKFEDIYKEIQRSNLSKICDTEDNAKHTCVMRSFQQGEEVQYRKEGNHWVCFRVSDNKIMKNVKYSKPNLKQFFTQEEIEKCNTFE